MSTQLRLVESPEPAPRRRTRTAKVTRVPRVRRAHWADEWRLDATTRRTGREGVRAARAALDRARRPAAELPRAS
jgi:hypothetical protein